MRRRCHHRSPRHSRPVRVERRRPAPGDVDHRPTAIDAEPTAIDAEPTAIDAEPTAIDAEPTRILSAGPDSERRSAPAQPERWVGPERVPGPRPESAPPATVRPSRPASPPGAPPAPVEAPAAPRAPRRDAGPRQAAAVDPASSPFRSDGPLPEPPHPARAEAEDQGVERTATAPQLRRFIKSRAYVPMHELRRRFAINGADDEVTPVDVDRHRVYVGLPPREGQLLGELLRGGDIGYELS